MSNLGTTKNRLVKKAVGEKPPYLKPHYKASREYKRVWRMIVEDFDPGHFFESDRPLIDEYVTLVMRLEAVRKECDSVPFVEYDDKGKPKTAPIHDLALKLSRNMASLARTLKLAPTARQQPNSAPKESQWQNRRKSEQSEAKRQVVGLRLA